jgi:hypothetical protein
MTFFLCRISILPSRCLHVRWRLVGEGHIFWMCCY